MLKTGFIEAEKQARDINFDALGRVEIVHGVYNLDQLVYRRLVKELRPAIGNKQILSVMDSFVKGVLATVSQGIIDDQASALNFFEYSDSELLSGMELVSYDATEADKLVIKVKVFLKNGQAYDANVDVAGGVLR